MAGDRQLILVINPGSTSTKLAIFDTADQLHRQTIEHPSDQLAQFDLTSEQFDLRRQAIEAWLETVDVSDRIFSAIAGRGAPLKPLEGGTYSISAQLLEDVRSSRYSNHASNLGPMLADYFSKKFTVPAFITDPITVDNFTDLARLSGLPEIERKCRAHALNIKAVGRREAEQLGKSLNESSFIVAHMGGGISVAVLDRGRIVDVNDGLLGMGPFSPDRAGSLPIGRLVELCYSGKYSKAELEKILSKKSGLMAYIGEADLRKVEEMIDGGDKRAELIFDGMCYQIAKEIGACATVLSGHLDGIILTGGMANSTRLCERISSRVKFIGPVLLCPGEFEMSALAEGAVRALDGSEEIKTYL